MITAKLKKETCRKTFCKKYSKNQYELTEKIIKRISQKSSKEKQRSKKILRKLKKKLPEECKEKFCNERCVGTIFEDGNTKKPRLGKEMKFLEKLLLQRKKNLFGKKRTVLKDNFYEKLPKKSRNKMKSLGAISGCVEMVPIGTLVK